MYKKKLVSVVALECLSFKDNKNLLKLVSPKSKIFNKPLVLQMLRKLPWPLWGSVSYQEILYTVWEINQNLKYGEKPLRIIGIDSDWNGPAFSFSRLSKDDQVTNFPWWENLQIFRCIPDLAKIISRDEIIADQLVKEVFKKNERAIVFIGAHHSIINYKQYKSKKGRMNYILSKMYPDKVTQIFIHTQGDPINITSQENQNRMTKCLENIFYPRVNFAFHTKDSPFRYLRDSDNSYFAYDKLASFENLARTYVYLLPLDKNTISKWNMEYINKEMFAKYKIFYETKFKKKFTTAKDVNSYFVKLFNEKKMIL